MTDPVWIVERDVLILPDRLLATYGGPVGLRDGGLLKSALARLELNGYRFTASEEDAAQSVLGMAAGTLDAVGYAESLRANSAPE